MQENKSGKKDCLHLSEVKNTKTVRMVKTQSLNLSFTLQDHPGLNSSSQIEKFQEKAQMELQDYVQKTYPDDTYRSVFLILVLHNPFCSYTFSY